MELNYSFLFGVVAPQLVRPRSTYIPRRREIDYCNPVRESSIHFHGAERTSGEEAGGARCDLLFLFSFTYRSIDLYDLFIHPSMYIFIYRSVHLFMYLYFFT